MNNKPYVVSADIQLLLQVWASENGFQLPSRSFFDSLRLQFTAFMSNIFAKFELVSEEELSEGLQALVNPNGLSVLSMDKVYYRSQPSLEVTRVVDDKGEDMGAQSRAGALPIEQQLDAIEHLISKEVALVDDVVFSGDVVSSVISLLQHRGISVQKVCTGIAIGEGLDKVRNVFGVEIKSVRSFNQVEDEICERDFYPGVPLSGRLLAGSNNVGVPYILPFGRPGKWASIPEQRQKDFSQFCLHQTIKLFEAIEQASGKVVRCQDLGRKVFLLPQDETRFVDALRQVL